VSLSVNQNNLPICRFCVDFSNPADAPLRADGFPRPAHVGSAQAIVRGHPAPQPGSAATADRRHGSPDRPAGLRTLWADGGRGPRGGGAGMTNPRHHLPIGHIDKAEGYTTSVRFLFRIHDLSCIPLCEKIVYNDSVDVEYS